MSQIPNAVRVVPLSQIIDLTERFIVAFLFLFLWSQMAGHAAAGSHVHIAIIAVEFTVLCFIVFRKLAHTVSVAPHDWFIAILGTSLAMLVTPGGRPLVPEIVSEFLMVFGFLIQIHGKISLNRSFGVVAANRGVKTGGPFACVRHPIYLGYTITHIGFLLFSPSIRNAALYVCVLMFQLARIMAEERVLSADDLYREYSSRVRYRLVPGLF